MSQPQSSSSPRLLSLQVFRGLAALWVLYSHLGVISALKMGREINSPLMAGGMHAVSFFFVLSGFIITYVHWKHMGDPSNVRPYLSRRLSRIYPPVFIVVGIKLLLILVAGSAVNKDVNPRMVVSSFLLLPTPVYLIDVLWTLSFEILFYILFALALVIGRKAAIAAAGGWVALIFGSHLMGYSPERGTLTGTVLDPYCLLFLMGGLSARIIASSKWMPRMGWLWVPGIALMAALIWFPEISTWISPEAAAINFLSNVLWGLASAMIILSATSMEMRKGLRWPAGLRVLGDASYSIYLVHTSIMMAFVPVVKRLGLNLDVWFFPVIALMGVVSLAGSLAFWKWVEVPLMAWWNKKILPVLAGGSKLREVPES